MKNGGVQAGNRLYWDLLGQWEHIKSGLRAACDKFGSRIVSVGVDTWGVDFGLLDAHGELLGNPVHYRDRRTEGILEEAFQVVDRDEIFAQTGLQFMQFNTLFQLYAMKRQSSPLLDAAESLLMMPDLFHWLLSGEKSNEYTDATTTQFFNPQENAWATSLLERFELPTGLLGPVSPPGTRLGPLQASVASEIGAERHSGGPAGHARHGQRRDGGAGRRRAGQAPDWCYISSGTWSLMGVEVPAPVVTDAVPRAELHQRRWRGRHDPVAEEHRRAVAGAAMPGGLAARGTRVRLEPADAGGQQRQAAGVAGQSG